MYPSLTPYKRRLQAGHADGWGLGGSHTDDGDQIPQIPNSGSNPFEGTLNGPGSNLVGGAPRGGRSCLQGGHLLTALAINCSVCGYHRVFGIMYMFRYITSGTMTDKHSIAEARRNLPRLVREAEEGMEVALTRRGKPVAVLIGWRRFERLASNRRGFTAAYRDFTNESDLAELALDPDDLFARTRESTPGRDVRL